MNGFYAVLLVLLLFRLLSRVKPCVCITSKGHVLVASSRMTSSVLVRSLCLLSGASATAYVLFMHVSMSKLLQGRGN